MKHRLFRFAQWELNVRTRRLINPQGEPIELSNIEFNLLVALLTSPRQTLSRDRLLEVSRVHDDIHDRSIDVQILRLRRKLEKNPSEPELIKTERGAGYYFDAAVSAE
jgi:DNA-binding response OmpR family regulator